MESEGRMDEFTVALPDEEEDKNNDAGEGEGEGEDATSYRPRYTPAPEHLGIAQRAKEMEALREDRVRRRREVDAESQWRAARGKSTLEEENHLSAWAERIRGVHEKQVAGSDNFKRGYLTPRGSVAHGPKPPVVGAVKLLNCSLPCA
jgi:hypothetical protein